MTVKQSAHPIDRARENLAHQPLLAVDLALLALGATRGLRSDAETCHYLDVLSTAIMAANSCPKEDHSDPVTTMLAEGTCDTLATAALLRLLVLDVGVFTDDERLRPAIGLFDRVLEARPVQKRRSCWQGSGVREAGEASQCDRRA